MNIDTELPNTPIKDTSVLKKLAGGKRQPIRIERKGQMAYDTYLHAKLFFSSNSIKEAVEQTPAYYRREAIITFPNTFDKDNVDPFLLHKLTSKEEMSGIFNILMIALRRILQSQDIYLDEKTIEGRREKYERAVDPIQAFWDEAVEDESTESDCTSKSTFYSAYVKYCRKHKLAVKNMIAFGKELKKRGKIEGRRRTDGADRSTCWLGVKLKEEYYVEERQEKLLTPSSNSNVDNSAIDDIDDIDCIPEKKKELILSFNTYYKIHQREIDVQDPCHLCHLWHEPMEFPTIHSNKLLDLITPQAWIYILDKSKCSFTLRSFSKKSLLSFILTKYSVISSDSVFSAPLVLYRLRKS